MEEKELTKEQKTILEETAQEWEKIANGGDTSFDEPAATKSLQEIYRFAGLKEPEVLFFEGPRAALEFCKKELGQEIKQFDAFGLGYDAGWIAFYDFFQRIGKLPKSNAEFAALKTMARAGVWATVLFDTLALAIARPAVVRLDDQNRLHCSDGPCVAFADGAKYYFWHGTRVTKQIIEAPETLTQEQITGERNSEVTRAIVEKITWPRYLEKIDVVLIDKYFDPDQRLHYELYDFRKRRFPLAPRMLKMESPEVLDGSRPTYVEPVDYRLPTCKAARKWQFKVAVCSKCKKDTGTSMRRHGDVQIIDHILCQHCGGEPEYRFPEVDECIKNPELTFVVEA